MKRLGAGFALSALFVGLLVLGWWALPGTRYPWSGSLESVLGACVNPDPNCPSTVGDVRWVSVQALPFWLERHPSQWRWSVEGSVHFATGSPNSTQLIDIETCAGDLISVKLHYRHDELARVTLAGPSATLPQLRIMGSRVTQAFPGLSVVIEVVEI